MNLPGVRHLRLSRYVGLCTVLALFLWPALLHAKKGSAPKSVAPHSAPHGGGGMHGGMGGGMHGGGMSGGHGPTTSGHGFTTNGHGGMGAGGRGGMGAGGRGGMGAEHGGMGAGRGMGAGGHGMEAGGHGGMGRGGFGGGRVPKGASVAHTRSGGMVTRRANGRIASLHDPKRGMDIHRGLNGNRRVMVERGDHSRVFVGRGGHGYVQRPYMYHGHEFARRSYYYHGHYYNRYYGRYYYRGVYVNPYYPAYYYGPAFYGWAYNPWAVPVAFAWGWGGNPWYGYYGAYFTPYPVYAGPAFWLTDYVISTSLAAAYQEQVDAQQTAALSDPAPLTPEVKQAISDEVQRQIALENEEAKNGAVNSEPDEASSSIQRDLTDGIAHVFVVGQDLDVVDISRSECTISEGDALRLTGQDELDATSADLTVLASKGGNECPKGDTVAIGLEDLQDMQNHMRASIDQGLQELQKKQGQDGLPAAPPSADAPPVETAMASTAPPPPSEQDVASELSQESKEADAAEQEAATDTGGAAPANAGAAPNAGPPPTVALGQTPDQVTAAMGNPKSIMDLGHKKIYVYQDMKVTFHDGKVTDIQ